MTWIFINHVQAMTWKNTKDHAKILDAAGSSRMLDLKLTRARRALDQKIAPLRGMTGVVPPRTGWLRAVRQAIGMSGQQFADRLGVSWQTMDDLEKSEAAGTVTINTLRRAARALNCHLVYALVPDGETLEETVMKRARDVALRDLSRIDQTMALEDQAASADAAEERIGDYIVEHVRDRDLWAE